MAGDHAAGRAFARAFCGKSFAFSRHVYDRQQPRGFFGADESVSRARAETTNEKQGEAYGYNFVYSGDFALKAQIEQNEELRIVGGINDYDFSWELQPGKKFVTPEIVMAYSDSGLGGMSRAFHDLYREYLVNSRFSLLPRPIVINNWEATYADFDTKNSARLSTA